MALAATLQLAAAEFRTDINPALKYYLGYLEAPHLSDADQKYLFVPEWRGKPLDARFGELLGQYNNQFAFLRQARFAKVPCDWGIDLTEGPDALLPGLAKAKAVAQTAKLRTLWHLKNGKPNEAREDLLSAFVLGRNVSRDGVLVSALVQYAIENIVVSAIADNFYQLPADTLKALMDGIDASPARGSIAQCVDTEKLSFHDWLLRKVQEYQKAHPGDDSGLVEWLRRFNHSLAGEASQGEDVAANLVTAGGGTSAGVIKLLREMEEMYRKVSTLLSLPYIEFDAKMDAFEREINSSSNPLLPMFFRVFRKCRNKEYSSETRVAMLHAAVEYKMRGESGFKIVKDPTTGKPFEFERFVLEGVDRGFKLTSGYKGGGFADVFIFTEKDGAPFYIMGPHVGQPL